MASSRFTTCTAPARLGALALAPPDRTLRQEKRRTIANRSFLVRSSPRAIACAAALLAVAACGRKDDETRPGESRTTAATVTANRGSATVAPPAPPAPAAPPAPVAEEGDPAAAAGAAGAPRPAVPGPGLGGPVDTTPPPTERIDAPPRGPLDVGGRAAGGTTPRTLETGSRGGDPGQAGGTTGNTRGGTGAAPGGAGNTTGTGGTGTGGTGAGGAAGAGAGGTGGTGGGAGGPGGGGGGAGGGGASGGAGGSGAGGGAGGGGQGGIGLAP